MTAAKTFVAGSLMCLLALAGTSAQAQTFSDPVTYTLVNENPGRAATGDLDGDGDPDIAVPTYVSGSPGYVEVLLNLGDGSFSAPTAYGVGNDPRSVAVADLDGDGDLDLAVANRGDGTVSVLTNRGDGTFEAAVDHVAGSSPFVVVAGDLDGDGLADLAVTNTYEVSWLANNGDGTFSAPQGYSFPDEIVGLDIGEMEGNGDTDLDLVVLEKGGNSSTVEAWVTVLWNDGSGSFTHSPRYGSGSWSDGYDWALHPSVDSLALGDLNGDGYLDVQVGAKAGWRNLPLDGSPLGRIYLLENDAGGWLYYNYILSCHDDSPQLDTGDLDSDGDLDVVTGRVFFLNDGTGYFGGRQSHGGGGKYVTVDDLDPDGLPDLVLPAGPDSVNVVLQVDLCPDDPNKTDPGQCGCDQPDTDSDGDGVADCIDQCPGEPDTDSDGDGVLDCIDGCPDDPDKTDPGTCGCGYLDDDSDGDGVADCVDSCPRYDDMVDCNGNWIPDGCDVGGGWMVGAVSKFGSGGDNEFFGGAVSVHGDVAVVGANGSGSTYVYRNWAFEQTLPGPVSWGGWDVDVHGDVIAIGGGGPVRLFRYNAGAQEWQPEQELPSQGQYFGHSVSLHGDTLVVGSERDDDRGEDAGAAYVYRYSGGSWVEQGKLLASDGDAGDWFGTDVAIYEDALVIGACNTLTSEHGAAYIFRLNGGDWVEEQRLTDPDTIRNNDFGRAVAIAGNVAVISAPRDDELGASAGAAHTFRFDGNAWIEEQKLTATDGEPGDEFGRMGLSVDGNTIVVGADMDDDRGQDAGSAYMFHFDEGAARWVEHWKLYATHSDAPDQDYFGRAVAVHGGNIVAGARWSDNSGTHSGAAFIYEFATFSTDCDFDFVPDECQPDTDLDGLIDACDACPDDNPDDPDGNGICGDQGGGPRTDVVSDTVGHTEEDHYSYDVVEGTDFSAYLATSVGQAQVYVKFGAPPTTADYTCSRNVYAGSEWGCDLTVPTAETTAYVMVYGAATGASDYTLTVDYVSPGGGCPDGDGDGVCDADDPCPGDPDKIDPGTCGCGTPDKDSDLDGIMDCNDACHGFDDTADCDVNGIPDGCDIESGSFGVDDELTALDGAAWDEFGTNVAIDGNAFVVAAPYDDDRGTDAGSVYAYRYDPVTGGWFEEQTLTASDGEAGDSFGRYLSMHGDTIAVGAWGDDDLGPDSGSAYVYRYDGATWNQEQKLTAFDGAAGDEFGEDIAIHGDTLAIGAWADDDLGSSSGSVYVYRYDGNTWSHERKLTASDGAADDYFGYRVSIHGDTIVVGALNDNDKGFSSGSAYVYRYDGATWNQEQKLTASDGATGDRFGLGVSIHGDTIVVGAREDDDPVLGTDSGSAYVYRYDGATWNQEHKLTASDGAAGDLFGESVSTDGGTIAVGSYRDDDLGSDSGSVYVYRYDAASGQWVEQPKLTAPGGVAGDEFGWSVAIDNGTIVAGAHGRDDHGESSGAAYTFERPGTVSDCDRDGVPDACQPDTDLDGRIDTCDCDPANAHCSTDCTDGDFDGYCVTSDCDDAVGGSWATPGEVAGLRFDAGTKDDLSWDRPSDVGGLFQSARYDAVRSDLAADFGGATCIESDTPVETATDAATPVPGSAFHYLVRIENGCPAGGTLGHDSQGGERSAPTCP